MAAGAEINSETGRAGLSKGASRTDRYMRRLRDHLAFELQDDAERRAFLQAEIEKWNERFAAFTASVDAGRDPGDVTAWDYEETLGALTVELAKYREVEIA